MEILAIKCSDGFFVQKKTASGYYYDNSPNLRFAGETVQPTWSKEWFKVSQIGLPVSIVIPAKKEISGYALKEEYPATDAMPKEVSEDFFKYEGDDQYANGALRGLYEPVYREIPETYEDVEAEIKIIAEVEGELLEKSLQFPVYGEWASEGKNWRITNQQVKVSLIDEITLPRVLHQEVPCELSSEDSYKIIRTHIKDNINPKVAELKSDYDFCLTVVKKIPLSEKEEYTVDENAWSGVFGGRKKKPKIVTKYRTERNMEVYATAPSINGKVFNGYTKTPEFRGKDAEDLKQNIDTFLKGLMEEINRPLKDCPTCKGHGVIEETI